MSPAQAGTVQAAGGTTTPPAVRKGEGQQALEAILPRLEEAREFKRKPPIKAANNWASSMGHSCERNLYYRRAEGDKAVRGDWKGISERGNTMADWWKRHMMERGFRIIHDQVPLSDDLSRKFQISGRIDGKIAYGDSRPVLYEFKTMADWTYKSIKSYEDMAESRSEYLRAYPAQLQLYLLDQNQEAGLFVLCNAQTWEFKFIPVYLDFAYTEWLLGRAARVNEAVAKGDPPERIAYDPKVCGRCEFAQICLPDIKTDGVELIDHERMLALVKERETLKEAADRYGEVDDEAKELAKAHGKDFVLGGEYMVQVRKTAGKRVDTKALPIEVRTQYEVATETTRVQFVPLGGKEK